MAYFIKPAPQESVRAINLQCFLSRTVSVGAFQKADREPRSQSICFLLRYNAPERLILKMPTSCAFLTFFYYSGPI